MDALAVLETNGAERLTAPSAAPCAINFLPFIDFRSYKVGNYIPELMEPSAELKYSYIMEKDGRTYEFVRR